MPKSRTVILMATYNGEKYLSQQLDSLFAQTDKDWVLYVCDDGSADSTTDILQKYAECYDNIVIIEGKGRQGAKGNFFGMLEQVEADVFFFCDQDDVWLPEKVERERKKLGEMVEKYGNDTPLAVYSDLLVVDQNLDPLHQSFWHFSGIHPERLKDFNHLGVGMLTTGCTMCFNAAARKVALSRDYSKAVMHDVWLTLSVVHDGGYVEGISEPLMKYRQHSGNEVGAIEGGEGLSWLAKKIKSIRSVVNANKKQYEMLKALNYGSLLKYLWYKTLHVLGF